MSVMIVNVFSEYYDTFLPHCSNLS